MRETVLGETPASLATISSVTVEPFVAAADATFQFRSTHSSIPRDSWRQSGRLLPGNFAAPQHNAHPNEYRMEQRLTRVPGVR